MADVIAMVADLFATVTELFLWQFDNHILADVIANDIMAGVTAKHIMADVLVVCGRWNSH